MLVFNNYNEPELEYINCEKISSFNYDENIIDYDLHTLKIPEDNYDFVIINQTLEHLYDPKLCIENIYTYLKESAYFYCNVPTVNIIHSYPYNYYTGFTPVGLGCLLKQCGFNILEIGSWGNCDYINKIFNKKYWPDYNQVDKINDFDTPCQCWILAKK